MSSISSTVYAKTPEQVVRVWEPFSRAATETEKRNGKASRDGMVHGYRRTEAVGCTHYECRPGYYRYGYSRGREEGEVEKSANPATTAWVTQPYYNRSIEDLGVVFYCRKHTGRLRSVRARARGYEEDVVMQVAGERGKNEYVPEDAFDLATVDEVAANPGAYIVLVFEKRQQRVKDAAKARLDYIDEHRQEFLDQFHSERDGQSYFGATATLEPADEYGRRYIKLGGSHYNQRANPADARKLAAELLRLADEAERETPRS